MKAETNSYSGFVPQHMSTENRWINKDITEYWCTLCSYSFRQDTTEKVTLCCQTVSIRLVSQIKSSWIVLVTIWWIWKQNYKLVNRINQFVMDKPKENFKYSCQALVASTHDLSVHITKGLNGAFQINKLKGTSQYSWNVFIGSTEQLPGVTEWKETVQWINKAFRVKEPGLNFMRTRPRPADLLNFLKS